MPHWCALEQKSQSWYQFITV